MTMSTQVPSSKLHDVMMTKKVTLIAKLALDIRLTVKTLYELMGLDGFYDTNIRNVFHLVQHVM